MQPRTQRLFSQLVVLGLTQLVFFMGAKWLIKQMDPDKEKKDKAAAKGSKLLKRLDKKKMTLTEYENRVSGDVIDPTELSIGWKDIGGLESVILTLKESIVLPLTRPDLFPEGSALLRAPRGLLLHGPPGCGKTLLIKALAKETDCSFISLQPSTFMDKWFGESQKLVEAVFSLAEKLAPAIIFVDEIDAFLRERSSSDNESSAQIKAQFMFLWDGFSSAKAGNIVVVGATNRPNDVDQAILRRMPIRCKVGLPNQNQRTSILTAILRNESTSATEFDLDTVAAATQGFSGNDLQELCRAAAMRSIRQFINLEAAAPTAAASTAGADGAGADSGGGGGGGSSDAPRPKAAMTTAHFLAARDEWLRTNPALSALFEDDDDDDEAVDAVEEIADDEDDEAAAAAAANDNSTVNGLD